MLLGAFPRNGLDDDGIRMWSEALQDFKVDEAKTTASRFVQDEEFMPSIAKFRATHRNLINTAKRKELGKCTRTDCWSGWCRPELYKRWLDGTIHHSLAE